MILNMPWFDGIWPWGERKNKSISFRDQLRSFACFIAKFEVIWVCLVSFDSLLCGESNDMKLYQIICDLSIKRADEQKPFYKHDQLCSFVCFASRPNWKKFRQVWYHSTPNSLRSKMIPKITGFLWVWPWSKEMSKNRPIGKQSFFHFARFIVKFWLN